MEAKARRINGRGQPLVESAKKFPALFEGPEKFLGGKEKVMAEE